MFEIVSEPKTKINSGGHGGPMSEAKIENADVKPDFSRLNEIANQAAGEESVTGFMQPGTKVKKPRGRPPGKAAPKTGPPPTASAVSGVGAVPVQGAVNAAPAVGVPIQQVATKKIVEPAVKLISRVGVGLADDPRAAMTLEEINDISEALALCMDKWMPLAMAQYSAEAALVMAVSMWGTKVYAIKQLKIEEKKKVEKMATASADIPPTARNADSDFSSQTEIKESRAGYL